MRVCLLSFISMHNRTNWLVSHYYVINDASSYLICICLRLLTHKRSVLHNFHVQIYLWFCII